jgi:hypothetical protein
MPVTVICFTFVLTACTKTNDTPVTGLDTSWLIHLSLKAESCLARCSVHVCVRMRFRGDVLSAKVVSVYQVGLSLCRNQTTLCALTASSAQLDVLLRSSLIDYNCTRVFPRSSRLDLCASKRCMDNPREF